MPGVRINEASLVLLRLVADEGNHCDGLSISIGDMARELGKSPNGARYAMRALVSQGLIDVSAQHMENGGRIENLYKLTDAGREVIAAGVEC